jgi:hypothetical protein
MKELATEETPIVKMKAIALALVFATSSTLALAGAGSVELPVWASPSDISSSHFNLGNVAPGNPAVERMHRAAPQRGDYRRRREARRPVHRAQAFRNSIEK